MESSPFLAAEEKAFLDNDTGGMLRRRSWTTKSVIAFSLAVHILLFAVLGSILVFTVNKDIPKSTQSGLYQATEFGGLPVQFDDPTGPYTICPSAGGPLKAIEAGCQMDLFANGWVPAPCFDTDRHNYFTNLHDYRFWADEGRRHRVHQDTLLKGNLDYPELFVSFEEHWEHCRYLLNGTQRHVHNPNLGILDIHMDAEHMNHCIDFLQESRDPYTLEEDVIAYFGYRKCFLPRLHLNSAI